MLSSLAHQLSLRFTQAGDGIGSALCLNGVRYKRNRCTASYR